LKPRSVLLACALCAVCVLWLSACSKPAPSGPVPIVAASTKFDVKGQVFPLSIGQVDGVRIEDGKIVIRGGDQVVTEDIPAGGDPTKPNTHWALTTETALGNQRRITFTQDQSVDDFSIDVPASDAMPHYGVLSGPNNTDVLVLAYGENGRSYWGYATIVKKSD